MKPFSFVHVADLHLGYAQYNLDARREDFNRAFTEVVEKTLELKPDFMIIAGDIFQHARPSNVILENAITNFRRLRDADIPAITVDGSHDSAPNAITGTILTPLDSAGLLHYLPRHEGSSWQNENCYIYGIPNFRTRQRTEERLLAFMEENKLKPDPSKFNIFVFHTALDLPEVTPPQIEAEARPELIPEGFNYYAGGHIHKPYKMPFKNGILVYSGCTETVNYEDAKVEKGFYHIKVNAKGIPKLNYIRLKTPRRFIILKQEFTGYTPKNITEKAVESVKKADEPGAVIVPVLQGTLPAEARRGEIDLSKIRRAAVKALHVHPLLQLRETEVSEEVIRSIFKGELKDLPTKAYEYFIQIFSERYPSEEAEKIARLAVDLIEPLTGKEETKVKEKLEAFSSES
ncbi:MAG: exonuclease SbcCD subunit D [Candidatus Bathyarchaeia archaeon]